MTDEPRCPMCDRAECTCAPTGPLTRARALVANSDAVHHWPDETRVTIRVPLADLRALCDELERAREVVEAARALRRTVVTHDWYPEEHDDLGALLARYDAARRGEAG